MQSIYIETTIPSYATARPSRDILNFARQTMTLLFWEKERQKYDVFTSKFVYDECSKGDGEAVKRRLDFIKGIKMLPFSNFTESLAVVYQKELNIPERAKLDTYHLAICVEHKIDYLLSWNFTHMGGNSYKKLLEYNQINELHTPLLVTPDTINTLEVL